MKKILLSLLSLFVAVVSLRAVSAVPYTEILTFNMRLQGTGSASMTIYAESGSPSSATSVSSGTNDASTANAVMRPGKVYSMSVSGSGSGYYCWLSFIVPTGYRLYIDGTSTDMFPLGWKTTFSQNCTLELRPTALVTDAVPFSNFTGISLGKSITWEVGLGTLHGNRNAGRIVFKQYDLSGSPATRSKLFLSLVNSTSEVWSINDGPSNQTLRQVIAPLGVIDLLDDGGGGYWIRFFLHSQSEGSPGNPCILYGSPWKTIRVQSPAANQLKITETEGSVTRVSLLALTSGTVSSGDYVWTLQEGDGSTWLRTTTSTSTAGGGIAATGGSVTTSGSYIIHTFTGSGTFNAYYAPSSASVEYLVVAGGGGGAGAQGGGGGAGGFRTGSLSLAPQAYSITVGGGGAGGGSWVYGGNGGSSTFSSITSTGGGGGAYNGGTGNSGGSGGGAGHLNGAGGSGTAGQGNNGGTGAYGPYYPAGGGGGAGAVGGNAPSTGGAGGAGSASSISGSSVTYGGGGGGGSPPGGGAGGAGGGGTGGNGSTGPTAGTANRGGGGGGGGTNGSAGASGGSGIVVIRYLSIPAYREVVDIVRTGGTSGTVVAKTKYRYDNVGGWGEELTQMIADPDTAALTTTYTYHTNSANLGNYRRVRSVTAPTGGWSAQEYYDDWDRRGQLKYSYQPNLDSPSTVTLNPATGRVVYYEYTADWSGRYACPTLRQETINNVVTAKTTFTQGDVAGASPRRDYTYAYSYRDSSNYQTDYSERYRADQWPTLALKPYVLKNADQSQTSMSVAGGTYNPSTGVFSDVNMSIGYVREIFVHGSTNSSGATALSSWDGHSFASVYLIPNKSTMDTVIYSGSGYAVRTETWVYTGSSNFSLMKWENYTYNNQGRLTQRVANNGATVTNTYTNGLLTSTVGVDGTETQFTYDLLWRAATSVKKGASAMTAVLTGGYTYPAQGDITTTYTYDGANHATQTVSSGSSLTLTATAAYDLAGRITQSVAPGSYTTGYAYSSGGKIVTATFPGGATKVTETHLDGKVKQVTGTGVVNENFTYNLNAYGRREIIRQQASSTVEYLYRDWLERSILRQVPAPSGSGYTDQSWDYNNSGQLWRMSRTGFANTLYLYDTLGRIGREGLDVNANGSLDLASDDRIQGLDSYFYSDGSAWWKYTTSGTYATAGNAAYTSAGARYERQTGFGSNVLQETHTYDIYGNRTETSATVDRTNKKLTTTTDTPDSNVNAVQVAYNGLGVEARDTASVTMRYEHDGLGRQIKSIDPRTGATTTVFISGTSLVSTVTDPASVVQATYTYDSAGRVSSVKDAFNKYAYTSYTNRGELYRTWGDTTYPVEYAYNGLGQRTTMATYRGGSGWTASSWPGSPGTADTTTWNYHLPTGLVTSKVDAASKSVGYTYTQAGQLATRTWARGVVTTYGYSSTTGELTSVDYSDSTVDIAYTYNRLGKNAAVTDVAGTRTFTYNLGGTLELQREDLPAYFGYRRLTYGYDTATGFKGRPNALQLGTSGSPTADQSIAYGYASDGRLNSVVGGGQTFSYGYTPNSHLVTTVTNSSASYTDTRTYDTAHAWVYSRTSYIGSNCKAAFVYSRDNMGRNTYRYSVGEMFSRYGNGTEGIEILYGYNDRSELTSECTRLASTSTVLTGRNDAYAWDNIGNRASTAGTTHNGNAANYTTNVLNQYTQRTVPGVFDVAGAAGSGTTVTVNSSSTGVTRHGEYFFKGHGMSNSPNPVYTTLAVSDGTTTSNLTAFTAVTPQAMTYDDDGNMTSDGRFNYTYDAENRLSYLITTSTVTSAGHPTIAASLFYDYLGRRVRKVDSIPAGSTDRRFIYNGWNLVAEFYGPYNGGAFPSNNVRHSFWGLDLSGSMQGAGGVGGLLMVQEGGNSYLPAYDAMGNVHGMIKASDGSLAAAYEYDAFGNTLRESGPYAASNPFRYSTKYTDTETSLVYYGTRYYSPSLGRFINRDTIGEQGGLNLYAFVGNNGVNRWDYLGMQAVLHTMGKGTEAEGQYRKTSGHGGFSVDQMNEAYGSMKEAGGDMTATGFSRGNAAGNTYKLTYADGSTKTVVAKNEEAAKKAAANQGTLAAWTNIANSTAIPNANDTLLGQANNFVATVGGQGLDNALAIVQVGLTAVPRRIDAAVAEAGGGPGEALAFKMALGAAAGQMSFTSFASSNTVTVVHFTDQAGVNAIQASNSLRAGTYVTFPNQVAGLNSTAVESALEIQAGRGAFSTTFQVNRSTLVVPENGPLTSGLRTQFQTTQPATPGPFIPTPPPAPPAILPSML